MNEVELTGWRHPSGLGRPPMDEVVYKLRFTAGGKTHTSHYSDAKVAARWAKVHRRAGTLQFYGRYRLEERL